MIFLNCNIQFFNKGMLLNAEFLNEISYGNTGKYNNVKVFF